jgi:hypothetical protein
MARSRLTLEFSRLRASRTRYIITQLGRQDAVDKRKGSKSAAMSCWAARPTCIYPLFYHSSPPAIYPFRLTTFILHNAPGYLLGFHK